MRRASLHLTLGSLFVPLAALVSLDAAGQPSAGTFEVTPFGGYRFGGTFDTENESTSVELDDYGSFGLILNLREGPNTQWELIYSRQSTSADTSRIIGLLPETDVDIHYLQAGGTYQGLGTSVRPYATMTLGGTHISPQGDGLDSDTFWGFSIGGGLQLLPTARLGIRLEVRGWGTFVNSDSRLFCSSGPETGFCAVQIQGDLLWQLETSIGAVFRF